MSQASSAQHAAHSGSERTFLGHPLGLYGLFFTEMWERFSFYSMRAFLVLYMTKAMSFASGHSNEVYGAYLGFVYAAPFLGGILADRLLGQRRCIIIGGILMAAAQFTLAAHAMLIPDVQPGTIVQHGMALNSLFFLGLGMLSAGNGFFKPNISSIVGSLYEQGDPRRDGAFTIFYMGINIGAFAAGFSGQLAEQFGWHWGFILAGIGMLIGQIIFSATSHLLQGKGMPPSRTPVVSSTGTGMPKGVLVILGVILFMPMAAYLMANPKYVQNLALFVAIPVMIYLLWETFRGTPEERGRMLVIIILCCFSIMFWAFFELAGSAVNLFTDAHVDRNVPIFGELKASLLTASINPAFIILLGFPFAKLWVWLDKRRLEPSSPLKFALGLTQLGAGFFIMYLGAAQAGATGKCNISFMVLGFMLHTTGELCLSPVGLSTITKLSPARMVSTFMGVWFLSSSLGNVFGGWVGGRTEHYGFDVVFKYIALTAVASGVLLFLLVPILKKMMHGVK